MDEESVKSMQKTILTKSMRQLELGEIVSKLKRHWKLQKRIKQQSQQSQT